VTIYSQLACIAVHRPNTYEMARAQLPRGESGQTPLAQWYDLLHDLLDITSFIEQPREIRDLIWIYRKAAVAIAVGSLNTTILQTFHHPTTLTLDALREHLAKHSPESRFAAAIGIIKETGSLNRILLQLQSIAAYHQSNHFDPADEPWLGTLSPFRLAVHTVSQICGGPQFVTESMGMDQFAQGWGIDASNVSNLAHDWPEDAVGRVTDCGHPEYVESLYWMWDELRGFWNLQRPSQKLM
jgi:hypothetical protein